MQRSRSPASSCCTAFGRDSSNCNVSAFKIELHLQSGTQCFEPEPALRSKDCLLVLVICTRAVLAAHALQNFPGIVPPDRRVFVIPMTIERLLHNVTAISTALPTIGV